SCEQKKNAQPRWLRKLETDRCGPYRLAVANAIRNPTVIVDAALAAHHSRGVATTSMRALPHHNCPSILDVTASVRFGDAATSSKPLIGAVAGWANSSRKLKPSLPSNVGRPNDRRPHGATRCHPRRRAPPQGHGRHRWACGQHGRTWLIAANWRPA